MKESFLMKEDSEFILIDKYNQDKPILLAYGEYVYNVIENIVVKKFCRDPCTFFKVPLKFRLKTDQSLIDKAFYRKKNYDNPYNQITDKIGGRIVVLLQEEVKDFCKEILDLEEFDISQDRDFEEERLKSPELFIYQSNHFILRNKVALEHENIIIPEQTPLELQVRSLLQHAYSELTHDTVYKPNTSAQPNILRVVAQSMALIEVTDRLFSDVSKELKSTRHQFSKIIEGLEKIYKLNLELDPNDYSKYINENILDTFINDIEPFDLNEINKFIEANKFIFKKIKDRRINKVLYRQPIIILIYFLVYKKRIIIKSKWHLYKTDLEEVFIDLGFSYDK